MKINNFKRVSKFILVGGTAAVVNLVLMAIFLEALHFKSYFLKNVANIISMEIGIIYAFICNRLWTWYDAPRKAGRQLLGQFLIFHLAVFAGVLLRIGLFAFFELYGLYYLLNVSFGIGIAAVLNFILYDRIVFKEYLSACGKYHKGGNK